jgi:hypothetical protein
MCAEAATSVARTITPTQVSRRHRMMVIHSICVGVALPDAIQGGEIAVIELASTSIWRAQLRSDGGRSRARRYGRAR